MKKQYTKPTMKVCLLSHRTMLLCGSDYYYSGPDMHYEQGEEGVQF